MDKKGWIRRIPLLPALVFTIILTQIPFLATLIISFMNWEANYPNEIAFGTLNNYVQVFTDPALRSSVGFTIVLTVTVVIVSLALGLGISLLLNRQFFGRGIVRTFMITPFLIVPVAAALLWKHAIYNPDYGLLNTWLARLVGTKPFDIYSFWGIVWVHVITGSLTVKVILLTPAFRNMNAAMLNMNPATVNINKLSAEIRRDPKKYLKLSVF